MEGIKQFDIFWVQLDPTQGGEITKTRPCAIISPNEINCCLRTVIIVPITSTLRDYPFRVPCFVNGKNGEMAVDHIRAIDKSRILRRLGHLTYHEILRIRDVLNEMFCQ
ncbi:MAG: type II toxin-antitoxin system PemK/MazF family toxin [Prevotellaceae bacterium]|jgi:mRNA interferase MazF|nr:type II toxin-antitoxin system PemK/MazF family toxin [Prevotellaceae bacterium]